MDRKGSCGDSIVCRLYHFDGYCTTMYSVNKCAPAVKILKVIMGNSWYILCIIAKDIIFTKAINLVEYP